jgi:hypothetical protein
MLCLILLSSIITCDEFPFKADISYSVNTYHCEKCMILGIYLSALMMETMEAHETSVSFYQTKRSHFPEGSDRRRRCYENRRSNRVRMR